MRLLQSACIGNKKDHGDRPATLFSAGNHLCVPAGDPTVIRPEKYVTLVTPLHRLGWNRESRSRSGNCDSRPRNAISRELTSLIEKTKYADITGDNVYQFVFHRWACNTPVHLSIFNNACISQCLHWEFILKQQEAITYNEYMHKWPLYCCVLLSNDSH